VLGRFAGPCLGGAGQRAAACSGGGAGRRGELYDRIDRALDYLYGREYAGRGVRDHDADRSEGRQGGSSFKPYVLATALTQGMPLHTRDPAPRTRTFEFGQGIEPWEVSGGGSSAADLRRMTVNSYNTAYAALIIDVGPSNAVAMAHRLGITTPINSVPAAVLGSENVTALDMANAYATFANSGVRVPPVMVDQIEKADGTILWQHAHTQERVISAPIADTITDILYSALHSGTGERAIIGRPAAGKTGTGHLFRDAWFVGYTPQLSTAVWVGFPDAQISMDRSTVGRDVFGGTRKYPNRLMKLAGMDRPKTTQKAGCCSGWGTTRVKR